MAAFSLLKRATDQARIRFAALLLLGVLGSAGHVPFSLPFATVAAFYFAGAICLRQPNWIGAAKSGWWFGFGYFASMLSWIVEPFLVDIGKNGWMAPFALALTGAGFAVFWSAAFGFARFFGASVPARAFLLVAGIVGVEFLRSELLSGFPWGLLGYIWSETPIIQVSAYCGPYAMVAATVLAGVLPLAIRPAWLGAMASLVGISALWVAGQARIDSVAPLDGPRPQIRIVQPNVPQQLKWKSGHRDAFFERLLELTREQRDFEPELIVWPETAATFLMRFERGRFARIADSGNGAIVALGIRRKQGKLDFNSMVALDESGQAFAVYDKYRLVPFGEYFPLGNYLAAFGAKGLATQEGHGFSSGAGAKLLDFGTAGRFLPLICYEAIFPRGMKTEIRADALLQITNDGWFGRFSGPQQHLMQARMRAIEQGLPLVRSANTGISAVVDSYGRIVSSLGVGETGVLDASLPAKLPPTAYSKYGDLPWLAAIFALSAAIASQRRSKGMLDSAKLYLRNRLNLRLVLLYQMKGILDLAKPYLRNVNTVVFPAIMCVILLSVFSDKFLTVENQLNILRSAAVAMIVGVGQVFVISARQIDLSVGSVMGLTACLTGFLVFDGYPLILCFAFAVAVGAALGLCNGLIVGFLKVPALLGTLGMLVLARGVVQEVMYGTYHVRFPANFVILGQGNTLGVPNLVWVAAVVVIAGHFVLTRLEYGRYILAIGGNPEAARIAGIKVRKYIIIAFVVQAALVALAAFLLMGRMNSAHPTLGQGLELHIIAGVILGGTSLFGGIGRVWGMAIAMYLIAVLENGLLLAGAGFFWQQILLGLLLILSVAIQVYRTRGNQAGK